MGPNLTRPVSLKGENLTIKRDMRSARAGRDQPVKRQQEGGLLRAEERGLRGHRPADTSISNSQPSEPGEDTLRLLSLPGLWRFIIAAPADDTSGWHLSEPRVPPLRPAGRSLEDRTERTIRGCVPGFESQHRCLVADQPSIY